MLKAIAVVLVAGIQSGSPDLIVLAKSDVQLINIEPSFYLFV
jgi:hypothetical protein